MRSRVQLNTRRIVRGRPDVGAVRAGLCLTAGLLLSLTCGCESYPTSDAMADSFYLSPRKNLRELGRVTLVELDSVSAYPGISRDATNALFLELQKKQVFGVVDANAPVDSPPCEEYWLDGYDTWSSSYRNRVIDDCPVSNPGSPDDYSFDVY